MSGMEMGDRVMLEFSNAPEVAKNPGVQTISPMPMDRTGEPPTGLKDVGHRVRTYRDLVALERNPDVRPPSRSIDIHLTGNMERFMWSFYCVKQSGSPAPVTFPDGGRGIRNNAHQQNLNHPTPTQPTPH